MVNSVIKISDQALDKYDVIDSALVPSKDFLRTFGDPADYIEAHIYTNDDVLLQSDYNYKRYTVPQANSNALVSSLTFDPASYIQSQGYTIGTYKIDYRIYRLKIFTLAQPIFYISELSSDRTEVRITSTAISNSAIESGTLNFILERQNAPYFKDFYLDFGNNLVVNCVNIALDKNTSPYSIVVKLYEPLPAVFDLKSTLWFTEELASPIIFQVDLSLDVITHPVQYLSPANFDAPVNADMAISSTYQSINSLYSTNALTSYQAVVNALEGNSIDISVDYSDYANFIHFSSATSRLNNFVYKLQTIEGYQQSINSLANVPNYTSSVSGSMQVLQNDINHIIKKFDGYESYLYYSSESNAWPKISGTYPSCSLYPTTSSVALTWLGSYDSSDAYYGGMTYTASLYDTENQDNLVFSVPGFITEDPNNAAYLLFLSMIGQHFDNIWVYIKAMNDIHNASNSFKRGISKDMVFTALKSLGIKLYNNNTNENIFDYLIGNISGSYTVTGSNDMVSGNDRSKELFKRIYSNLPYLLKSRGTEKGIRALITTFGIPSTILDVVEYGGGDKIKTTPEYSYDKFSYALYNSSGSYFELKWAPLTQNYIKYTSSVLVPDAIELRFKPDLTGIQNTSTLLQVYSNSSASISFGVTLNYTSSNGVPSANVNLIMASSGSYSVASVLAPLYTTGSDGDSLWWNLLLTRNKKYTTYGTSYPQQYTLFVKNSVGDRVGFQASASININSTSSYSSGVNSSWSYYGSGSSNYSLAVGAACYTDSKFSGYFSGYLQEVRYWSEPLLEDSFNAHVLNPDSYEGNYVSSAFDDLAARFQLGNNLLTSNHYYTTSLFSYHPNWSVPYTFEGSSSLYGVAHYGQNLYGQNGFSDGNMGYFNNYQNKNNYDYYYDVAYANSLVGGYYSPVTEKIRIVSSSVSSSVLSPFLRLETPDTYRTLDTHFTDVSFSNQNQIDRDIIAQYGNTLNLDEYIGDPGQQYYKDYPDLNKLRTDYFTKYVKAASYNELVNLVKSVDNTLFKMIEDYVPARANVSTGITVKSPILERNRVKRQKPVAEANYNDFTASLEVAEIYVDSNHINTNGSTQEFITGELTGSVINTYDMFEINNFNPYLFPTSSVNQSVFYLSEYNTTYGYVSKAITSSIARRVDDFNPAITGPAEIQDGYYTYKRHANPRYNGCKSTSQLYNIYTPGDQSYGKNAAIDYNVGKFGYVNQLNTNNLNIIDKTTFSLTSLIDASGSITNLSQQNVNLLEVQNTFKSGDTLNVSLLNALNPSNQSGLSGGNNIFLGGFSLSPILFREINDPLTFNFLNPTATVSGTLGFKGVAVHDVKWVTNNAGGYTLATVPDNVHVTLTVNGSDQSTAMASDSGVLSSWKYPYVIPVTGITDYFTFYDKSVRLLSYGNDNSLGWGSMDYFLPNTTGSAGVGYFTDPSATISVTNSSNVNNGYLQYTIPRQSNYTINVNIPMSLKGNQSGAGNGVLKILGIIEKFNGATWDYLAQTSIQMVAYPGTTFFGVNQNSSTITFDDDQSTNPSYFNCVLQGFNTSLNAGDEIRLKVYVIDIRDFFSGTKNITLEFVQGSNVSGYFEVFDSLTATYTPVTTMTIGTLPQMFTVTSSVYSSGVSNTLVFNNSASIAYNNTIFLNSGSSVSSSYSPVVDIFEFQVGDLVRFNPYSVYNSTLYTIMSVINPVVLPSGSTPYVQTPLQVVLSDSINSGSINSAQSFAFFRPTPDETSVIINKMKSSGGVSGLILVPWNLDPKIQGNIANIIQPFRGNSIP